MNIKVSSTSPLYIIHLSPHIIRIYLLNYFLIEVKFMRIQKKTKGPKIKVFFDLQPPPTLLAWIDGEARCVCKACAATDDPTKDAQPSLSPFLIFITH